MGITNIDPRVWGTSAWFIMYCVAFSYPYKPEQVDKDNTKAFYTAIGKVLPCEKCRYNFSNHLLQYPLTASILKDKKSVVLWVLDMNNAVNRSVHKPELSYEEVITQYDDAFKKSYEESIARSKQITENNKSKNPKQIIAKCNKNEIIKQCAGIVIPILLVIIIIIVRKKMKT
jgi:hypothetical protein